MLYTVFTTLQYKRTTCCRIVHKASAPLDNAVHRAARQLQVRSVVVGLLYSAVAFEDPQPDTVSTVHSIVVAMEYSECSDRRINSHLRVGVYFLCVRHYASLCMFQHLYHQSGCPRPTLEPSYLAY